MRKRCLLRQSQPERVYVDVINIYESRLFMALYASHITRAQYLVAMGSFQFDTGRNIESH